MTEKAVKLRLPPRSCAPHHDPTSNAPTSCSQRADYLGLGAVHPISHQLHADHDQRRLSSRPTLTKTNHLTPTLTNMSMLRTAFASSARSAVASSSRGFHTSPVSLKVTEKVAEVADKVNKKVGKTLASAIEKGEQATEKTKETIGAVKEKTSEASTVAGQKANQTAAGAREGARDFKHDVEKEARK
ncbi:hypothetical protein ACG7TL_000935 [Trametes sanguinea]